jgi:hypothetical protein
VIRHLDQLLRDLLLGSIAEITDETQVGFRPPDDDWIGYVATLTVDGSPVNALNVYLIELRENRKLRSNEVVRSVADGVVSETLAPMRLDCHYLITAWSAASVTPAMEPSWDEHTLLYEAAAALARQDPIVPAQIYGASGLGWPADFPDVLRDAELPVALVPVDGFPKYAEFWGTMGASHRWRPAIHLVVTLPVVWTARSAGSEVTTRVLDSRIGDPAVRAGVGVRIGGRVRDTLAPAPDGTPSLVAGAWITLEMPPGKRVALTRTNGSGEFQFGELTPGGWPDGPPGTCRLRVRATGHPDIIRDVDVPSASGEYDLLFE